MIFALTFRMALTNPLRLICLGLGLLALTGCASGLPPFLQGKADAAAQPDVPMADFQPIAPPLGATTAEALDTTTPEQRAAALAVPAPSSGGPLGTVSASLGAVTEPGFWLRTGLVKAVQQGRVELPGGKAVQVELRPGEGAAQLSLAAYRALGLGLTDLPDVVVYGP